jgi:MFS family permease
MTGSSSPHVPASQGVILALVPVMVVLSIIVPLPVIPAMVQAFSGEEGAAFGVSLAVTLPTLAIALAGMLLGMVGDRIDRRRLLVAGIAVFALAAPMPLWIDSLWLLIGSRFILGLALGAMTVAAVGLVGDYFSGARRAFWLSAQGSFPAAATIVGALLSGALGQYGWRTPFLLLLVGIPLLCAVFILRGPAMTPVAYGETPPAGPGKAAFEWRPLLSIFVLTIVASFMMFAPAYEFGYVVLEQQVTSTVLPGVMTAVLGAGAVMGALAPTALRKTPPERQLALYFMVCAAGQLTVALSVTSVGWVAGAAIIGLAQGAIVPVLSMWLLDRVDEAGRGRAVSVFQTVLYVSQFSTPHLARMVALVADSAAIGMLAYAIALSLLAIALGLAVRRRARPN